jgi:glycosyltransferase involved in cell wall biosynthesis
MKILQIIHTYPPYSAAGSEVYTYNLSRELSKRHKMIIFHRINELQRKDYEVYRNYLDGTEIYKINNTFRSYDSFEMTYKNDRIGNIFSEIVDKVKPDIAHIQHLLYLSTTIVDELKKRNIPIIFTLHDYWLFCPQGQLLKKDLSICNNDYSGCFNCIQHQLCIRKNIFNYYYLLQRFLSDNLLQWIKNNYLNYAKNSFLSPEDSIKQINKRSSYMRDICSKIDLFISPSEFLRERFIKFGIPENKIIFSQYGFNLEYFKEKQKTHSNKLRFACIGNILPAKGAHILIETFNKIKDYNVELKIYGEVSSYKGLLENYLRYIKRLAKNKNIRFMGGFNNKYVASIFKEIDVLIVPSIWYENSPLVIQEALASNTAVIASNIGGIPELIVDGRNGLLFKSNDADCLYEKVKQIIDNPSLLEEFRKNTNAPKDIKQSAIEMEGIYRAYVGKQ